MSGTSALPSVTTDERRRRLARRHRLAAEHRIDDVAGLADDLVALHSSDPVTVFLSVGQRMAHPSIEAIERALYDDRSVVRHHAMRRTLWVMTPDVAAVANASSTRKIAAAERKKLIGWVGEVVGPDAAGAWIADGIAAIEALLDRDGEITTRQIGVELPELAIPLELGAGTRHPVTSSAHPRLVLQAAFEGRLVRTRPRSWTASEYRWQRLDRWLGRSIEGPDVATASAALVDRYLRRFGPATETDLRWWTGWTATQTRAAVAAVDAERVDLDGTVAFVAAGDAVTTPESAPWVALLPGLDPTVMGWKERSFMLEPAVEARVFDRWGNSGPVVMVDGMIIGGWVQRPDGEIALDLVIPPDARAIRLIEREVDRLRALVGDDRFRFRFPSPNQKQLLADGAELTE